MTCPLYYYYDADNNCQNHGTHTHKHTDTPFQFMDAKTMKEVAEMEDTVGHGLDRDGGMWMLASMVSNAVKNKGDAKSILQIEAGDVQQKNDRIDGVLRRKRRTRR